MQSIKELETQISKLSPEKLAEFRAWFEAFDAEIWDREFESDVKSGNLESIVKEAVSDYKSGNIKEL